MKKWKLFLTGSLLITMMAFFTACGIGNTNRAADETKIEDNNVTMDDAVEGDLADNFADDTEDEILDGIEEEKNSPTNSKSEDNQISGSQTNSNKTENSSTDSNGNNANGRKSYGPYADTNGDMIPGDGREEHPISDALGDTARSIGNGMGDAIEGAGDALGNAME